MNNHPSSIPNRYSFSSGDSNESPHPNPNLKSLKNPAYRNYATFENQQPTRKTNLIDFNSDDQLIIREDLMLFDENQSFERDSYFSESGSHFDSISVTNSHRNINHDSNSHSKYALIDDNSIDNSYDHVSTIVPIQNYESSTENCYEIANSHSNFQILHNLKVDCEEDNIDERRPNVQDFKRVRKLLDSPAISEKSRCSRINEDKCDIEQCLKRIEHSLIKMEKNLLQLQDLDIPQLQKLVMYSNPSIQKNLSKVKSILHDKFLRKESISKTPKISECGTKTSKIVKQSLNTRKVFGRTNSLDENLILLTSHTQMGKNLKAKSENSVHQIQGQNENELSGENCRVYHKCFEEIEIKTREFQDRIRSIISMKKSKFPRGKCSRSGQKVGKKSPSNREKSPENEENWTDDELEGGEKKKKKLVDHLADPANSALVPDKLISLSLSLLLAALLQAVRCLADLVEDAFKSLRYDRDSYHQ